MGATPQGFSFSFVFRGVAGVVCCLAPIAWLHARQMSSAAAVRRALLVIATTAVGAHAAELWRDVHGAELRAVVADHELADGVHYAYRFRGDGTLTGFSMGKAIKGVWRVSGDDLCWKLARRKTEEECYQIQSRGRSVRLMRDGYEVFAATITPITNPTSESQ